MSHDAVTWTNLCECGRRRYLDVTWCGRQCLSPSTIVLHTSSYFCGCSLGFSGFQGISHEVFPLPFSSFSSLLANHSFLFPSMMIRSSLGFFDHRSEVLVRLMMHRFSARLRTRPLPACYFIGNPRLHILLAQELGEQRCEQWDGMQKKRQ